MFLGEQMTTESKPSNAAMVWLSDGSTRYIPAVNVLSLTTTQSELGKLWLSAWNVPREKKRVSEALKAVSS